MRAGDLVLKRSSYRGNVRWTFPHRFAGLWGDRIGDGNRIDTTDWALVTVDERGSWPWKDEDEPAEAVELGVFGEAGAAAVRAEGERVLAGPPLWPTGEGRRPPAGSGPLRLPEDRHVV